MCHDMIGVTTLLLRYFLLWGEIASVVNLVLSSCISCNRAVVQSQHDLFSENLVGGGNCHGSNS